MVDSPLLASSATIKERQHKRGAEEEVMFLFWPRSCPHTVSMETERANGGVSPLNHGETDQSDPPKISEQETSDKMKTSVFTVREIEIRFEIFPGWNHPGT